MQANVTLTYLLTFESEDFGFNEASEREAFEDRVKKEMDSLLFEITDKVGIVNSNVEIDIF